jgi:SAM-dependent methyltransferase
MQTRHTLPLHSLRWLYDRSRQDAARRHGCVLLDIRPPEQTQIDHLPGAAQISTEGRSFDREALPSHLLPPPGGDITIFAEDPERAHRAAGHLVERGWNASAIEAVPSPEYFLPGPSTAALWAPDAFVAAQLDRLPPVDAGPIVDLGAGSGRDGVFLAQQGYDLLLVDRLPDALQLAADRASRHGAICRHEVADLRRPEDFSATGFAAALAIRCLPRATLARLHERMLPGGILLLNAHGPRLKPSNSGPSPAKRVSIDALGDLISTERWEMLVGPQEREADGDNWVQLVARRRLHR